MKLRMFSLFLCFFIFMSSFTSFADISETEPVKSWQEAVDEVKAKRASASALEADFITMDLTDDDYSVSPYSSVGTVTNTVDYSGCAVQVNYVLNGESIWSFIPLHSDGTFSRIFPDGAKLKSLEFYLYRTALPSSGKYKFSFDFSSDFSFDWDVVNISYSKSVNNASNFNSYYDPSYNTFSGDVYISPFLLDLGSISRMAIRMYLNEPSGDSVGGSVRFNFTQSFSSSNADSTTPGVGNDFTQQDYQNGVTSGLSNIGDTLEEIVETISMQLEALWNQIYNFMHLPQYEKLEQIRQAIENLDLNIDVDQSELIAKIQEQIENDNTNTDRLINSYDNSGLTQSNDDLNQYIDDYDSQEQEVMDQVSGYVSDFEYESYFDKFTAPMSDISYFLTGIYEGLAGLNIPIGFSLTLMIALICIGFYRFKGGG